MIIQDQPPLHLTYGLNIHPGETWPELRAAVEKHAAALKARVAPDRPFGLGLRVSREAASALADPARREELKRLLAEGGFYVFTINGFPYGRFHGAAVKERVYEPDWRAPERLAYTLDLADLLASLLPEGLAGSISTVPVCFRGGSSSPPGLDAAAARMADAARGLARLRDRTGRDIHLGLEPEPGCLLERADEAIGFLRDRVGPRLEEGLSSRLGLCLDVCHAAVAFEDPAEALQLCETAGVRVSKVQLSASLDAAPEALDRLAAFCEPTYLHQTAALFRDGSRRSWSDLPQALAALRTRADAKAVRVHFHVPLPFEGGAGLRSTAFTLTPGFFARLRAGATEHLEIETYSLPVMPDAKRRRVTDSLEEEYRWVLARLRPPS